MACPSEEATIASSPSRSSPIESAATLARGSLPLEAAVMHRT